ncbi:MAG: CotH kinase family protein [Ruminococcus sp.]|nr:CotH kinase family protein [Ruminococcus sp.]
MDKLRLFALPLIAAALITGCSGVKTEAPESAKEESSSSAVLSSEAEESEPEGSYSAGEGIALITIDTLSTDPDVMDFVEKPVARHVAEDIASWTPGYKIPPEPYYEDCTVSVTDESGALLIGSASAQVKVRGNWTTTYDKKPLRIKFTEKQSMLGLNDGAEQKNWVLLASYKDGSILRDKAALQTAGEILGEDGLYSADSRLVEVVINSEYWGVYLLTELQQTGSSRVDITEPEKGYTGTDIGYFLEYDGYFANEDPLHSFHVSYADNSPIKPFDGAEGGNGVYCLSPEKRDLGFTIKSDIYSQEQHDFIAGFVENAYRIMYEAAYNDKAYVFDDGFSQISLSDELTPQQAVEKAVNVRSLADMYIISELTCDADIYWSSFFMDADFGEGGDRRLTFEAPWDFDSGLGNKPRCADGTGFYAASLVPDVNDTYMTVNPWLAVLMNEEWFRQIIREKWTAAFDSGTFSRAQDMVLADAEKYSAAFERNYLKWNNLADKSAFSGELTKKAAHCLTHRQAAEYLAEWLGTRVDFLNDYWHE